MKPSIITISRQFGSGGRTIGAELAKKLNLPFFEKSLFEEASKRSGIHSDFFEKAEARKNWYFSNAFLSSVDPLNMSLDDQIYLAQVQTIRELAEQGPCIIVGRGANQILADRNDLLNIFIYADRKVRLKRIIEVYGVPENQAEKQMDIVDKNRATYLKHYANQIFGKAENYHLCIDSGKLGIENAIKIIDASYRTLE